MRTQTPAIQDYETTMRSGEEEKDMGEVASYMGVLRNASRNKPKSNLKDE